MRLHILFLLTSTVAFNVHAASRRCSTACIMGKRGCYSQDQNHPRRRSASNKPVEPAGGWPDDKKVLGELEQKGLSIFGVSLRDVQFKQGTLAPARGTTRSATTARRRWLGMCAAYVMVMCFSQEMVDTLTTALGGGGPSRRSFPSGSATAGASGRVIRVLAKESPAACGRS